MSKYLVRAATVVALLAVPIVAGIAMTFAWALLGHQVLVLIYGEDLAPIDDTLPMFVAVWAAYLAGILTGLAVMVLGWRRLLRRPTPRRRASAD